MNGFMIAYGVFGAVVLFGLAPYLLTIGNYTEEFMKKPSSYPILLLDHIFFGWFIMMTMIGSLGLAMFLIPVLMLGGLISIIMGDKLEILHFASLLYWIIAIYTYLRIKYIAPNEGLFN